jgi:hypothetical protein
MIPWHDLWETMFWAKLSMYGKSTLFMDLLHMVLTSCDEKDFINIFKKSKVSKTKC